MLTNILHPNRYHGFSAKPPYFEGWYYKLVSADQNTRFAIIPGAYISPDPAKSHAFVQVFDSQADKVNFHRYPFKAFKAHKRSFEIRVAENLFTADQISLSIADDLEQIEGSLSFSKIITMAGAIFLARCHGLVRLGAFHGVLPWGRQYGSCH